MKHLTRTQKPSVYRQFVNVTSCLLVCSDIICEQQRNLNKTIVLRNKAMGNKNWFTRFSSKPCQLI